MIGLAGFALPPDASADGGRIDQLFLTAAWLVAAVGLVVIAWLAIVLVRDRGRSPRHDHGDSRAGRLVPIGLTTLMFVAVDGTLFYGSTRDLSQVFLRIDEAAREPDAVRVQVNGHQWSWDFRQAGPDRVFGSDDDVVSLDRLVVPRGRAVVLEIASTDVVHGLYMPAFRVKIDAVPGQINRTWFRPVALGRYEVGCSQFCGVAHYRMLGVVEVVEPAAHAEYLAREAADARAIAREDERALAEEPGRPGDPLWPRWLPDPARARAWAWPWGGR